MRTMYLVLLCGVSQRLVYALMWVTRVNINLPLPSALEDRWPLLGMLKFGDTKPDDADSSIDSPMIIKAKN